MGVSPDARRGPHDGPSPSGEGRFLVSAVVPTFNARRFLGHCLGSVLAAAERHGRVEVIVVDNGSTDGTWSDVEQRQGDRVRVLQAPGVTIATVRNRGAETATGRFLAFIDADCEVPEDYFFAVERALASGASEASGAAYALPPAPRWVERVWHGLHLRNATHPRKYINGGNLVVSRDAFQRIGGFQETLITGEDADFCERLAREGLRIREDPSVVAIHHGNPKSLRAFVKKQAWHSIGSGRRGAVALDLPNALALAHALCGVTTCAVAVLGPWLTIPARVGLVLGGQVLVPALAVGLRVVQGGRVSNVPAAVLLYHLYFDVRFAVAVATVTDRRRAAQSLRGSVMAGPTGSAHQARTRADGAPGPAGRG
jgi:hypothetical protein